MSARTGVSALVLTAAALLTGCGSAEESTQPASDSLEVAAPAPAPSDSVNAPLEDAQPVPTEGKPKPSVLAPGDPKRVDDQGAVEVVIMPRNALVPVGGTIEFDVFMNTHSVDLSMDLAQLSTLEADSGVSVPAGFWSGGSGHHIQGLLTFPTADGLGRSVLGGARTLTLRIMAVDAPVREFQWELMADA